MRDEPPLAHLLEVAASTDPLLERARGVVLALDRWLRPDAIWLVLTDPAGDAYATVGSSDLEVPVRAHLEHPSPATRLALARRPDQRPAITVTQLGATPDVRLPWCDCILPTESSEGVAVLLLDHDDTRLGTLSLLFSRSEPPPPTVGDRLRNLAPVLARAVSPTRSLLSAVSFVPGATSGAVLFRDGGAHPLLELAEDPLLGTDSDVVGLARGSLLAGHVYRSFLWPVQEDSHVHRRVTVLAAADLPPFLLGTVLVSDRVDCDGLTPRELVVLGLLLDGSSNRQIARRLVIAPRTVATHVEHILTKLQVPTRTLAAVRAEREGCYVPAVAQPSRSPIRSRTRV